MRIGFRRQLIACAGALVLFLPVAGGGALADSPVETAIKDLVASMAASSGWTASYRALSYDAAADTAVLSGLAIATKQGELKIDFETISVAGYAPAADGGFTAKSIKADGGAIDAGPIKAAIGDVALDDVGAPAMAGGAYDPAKPFTSIMQMYSGILKTSLGHGRIGTLSLIETIQGMTNRISYSNFEISDVHDGKTASITAGPLKLEAPSPDGLVDMTIGGIEGSDIDFGAIMRVYDPAAYGPDGTGDMVWHQTLGHAAYKDIEMTLPGAKVAIDAFAMDAFKVRQPKHSFAAFLDAVMAHPGMSEQELTDAARNGVIDLFSTFAIGRFGLSGLKVQATGITQLELADFHVADLSIEGLGEIAIEGLSGAVEGQGAVKVGRFAFGGMKFPDPELLRTAMAASAGSANTSVPFDPTSLVPKLGFVEAGGLEIETTDVPHMALDLLRIDLGDYVGFLPTKVGAAMSGLDLPLDSLDRQARETFKRLGYDRVSLDYRLKYGWDEARQQLAIDDFAIRAADIGGITGSAVIGGLTREMIEHPEDAADAMQNLALVSGKLTFKDESIVGKGLNLLAEKMKAPPDKFRQQFADALPFLLSISALNNPTLMTILRQSGLMTKLAPAVKTFVAEPSGSLTLTMMPAQPVGLVAITEAADKAPETLIGLLNLSVSAEAGSTPADKAATPNDSGGTDLRPTIAPK